MFSFKNSSQMPSYLIAGDFDLWLDKFNAAINLLGLPHFACDLYIEFSSERKVRNYGSDSLDEIKDLIRHTWKTDGEIEKVLNQINGYDDYHNGAYEILAGLIHKNNPNTSYHDANDTIDGWFDNISFSIYVLGEYINQEKKIILYTRNIEAAVIPGRTNKEHFEKVFSHELFHAYHYKNDDDELIYRYDYTTEVVEESLASAFEWNYCILNKILGADELRQSWRKYPIWTYPYSGAENLLKYITRNVYDINSVKFADILNISVSDMDAALRKLLYRDDFYKIKNAVEVRNRYISKPSVIKDKRIPQVFVVKNAKSFNDESKGNYLFAPSMPRYSAMTKVEKGDVILHIFKNHLHAISIAKGKCYYSVNSYGRNESGNYIDSAYNVFPSPVDISCFKTHIHYPNKQGDPHYILLRKDLDIIEQILKKALTEYPNDVALLLAIGNLF